MTCATQYGSTVCCLPADVLGALYGVVVAEQHWEDVEEWWEWPWSVRHLVMELLCSLWGFLPEPGIASLYEECTETSPILWGVRASVSDECPPCIHLLGLKCLSERQFQTSHLPVGGKQSCALVGSNMSTCSAKVGIQQHLLRHCHCHHSCHCKKAWEETKTEAVFKFEVNNDLLQYIYEEDFRREEILMKPFKQVKKQRSSSAPCINTEQLPCSDRVTPACAGRNGQNLTLSNEG